MWEGGQCIQGQEWALVVSRDTAASEGGHSPMGCFRREVTAPWCAVNQPGAEGSSDEQGRRREVSRGSFLLLALFPLN